MEKSVKNLSVKIDFEVGELQSLIMDGKERLRRASSLFTLGLRKKNGERYTLTSCEATRVDVSIDGATYFFDKTPCGSGIWAKVTLKENDCDLRWFISAGGQDEDTAIEWADFPQPVLPLLKSNEADGGRVVWPFNEGVEVCDINEKEHSFPTTEIEYPSQGSYPVFPNMISSQMIAYLWDDVGLYVGAHDNARGVKGIDFFRDGNGVKLRMRIFSGARYGEGFEMDYPIVWSCVGSRWESAAEKYRNWFESNLPAGLVKIENNPSIPDWYEDAPLVVSYPVQGRYDSDQMSPNCYIPYTNALGMLDRIQKETESKLLVLLMHWEGTAPWAPPYVWPPVGGEQMFYEFKNELNKRGNLLGVYSSGFGYTLKSNLIKSYDKTDEFERDGLSRGMCTGSRGEMRGVICTIQRQGYDVCPASKVGKSLLDKAYTPLFNAEIDYLQVLDQNHGGGQYLCYEESHGHPTSPGKWMTENMQQLLKDWKERMPQALFGCESAAAEPFIPSLLFNDNRFELTLKTGRPIPLYQFFYHEYVRNFMGNQVGCPIKQSEDSLRYRIAYSFVAGDSMTIVVNPEGKIMAHWGREYFENKTDGDKVIILIRNLTRFYKNFAKPYLYAGRMVCADMIECEEVAFERRDKDGYIMLPKLYYSHWQSKTGKRATIVANPTEKDISAKVDGKHFTVPALDAILISID